MVKYKIIFSTNKLDNLKVHHAYIIILIYATHKLEKNFIFCVTK